MINIVKKTNQLLPSLTDELFSDFFTPLSKIKSNIIGPATNVTEDEKEITLSMAIPGIPKDKISISIDNRVLTISYSEEKETESKSNAYIRREYGLSSFSRSFTLPDNLSEELITSKLENGILIINCPKQEQQKLKIKSIEIQ